MLDASAIGSGLDALRNDTDRLGKDVAYSEHSLVNLMQPSATNKQTPAALMNWVIEVANGLSADLSRVEQDVAFLRTAILITDLQGYETLLSDLAGNLSGRVSSPLPPAANGGVQNQAGKPDLQETTSQVQRSSPLLSPSLQHNQEQGGGNGSLYVLNLDTGETVPSNVALNTFSTWSENLLAQESGGTITSISWDTSQAPDATNISGLNTANLQWTWSSFTGPARTDTISVTETPQVGQPQTQTITFVVAGTDSPAFSSNRPTSSSTWPTVITPDQLDSGQATQAAGTYANVGLTDGSVHTSFAMPSYNSSAPPGMSSGST